MECSFPLVPIFYANKLVAVLEVDFVKELCSSNMFLQLIHIGKGVVVWYCYSVDCSIVNAKV